MGSFFDYENRTMSKIARIADTVVLGVLWVICSIPVVTMGASCAALYYAYNRCIRQKLGYAWKTFFEAFRSNFKQATQIWLILLGTILLLALDCYLLHLMAEKGVLIQLLQAVIIVVSFITLLWGLHLFPYLSRFALPNKAVMKNCALIMFANLPQSLLLLVIFSVCTVGFICLPVLNLLIPAGYIVFANRIQEKIFRKYMRPEDLEVQLQAEQFEA